jgi:hypothetical protein
MQIETRGNVWRGEAMASGNLEMVHKFPNILPYRYLD